MTAANTHGGAVGYIQATIISQKLHDSCYFCDNENFRFHIVGNGFDMRHYTLQGICIWHQQ
ncbi:MAG TPA: hypothetical protein VK622_06190 [Puia sp.]|nr:hypothetical protein [Puia sp.]